MSADLHRGPPGPGIAAGAAPMPAGAAPTLAEAATSTEAPNPAADGRATGFSDSAALTPAQLLRLMWLASPALPVGGFSYSEGLEAAVDAGLVSNEAQAGDWLLDQLLLAQARADLAVLGECCTAWHAGDVDRIAALNAWMLATRESAEFRLQTEQMGRSLTEWLRNEAGPERPLDPRVAQLAALAPAPTWPVAYALAATLAGAPPAATLQACGFSWAENMVQAAMKAVPLGQAAAQRMLARLAAALPEAVAQALQRPAEERQAATPMLAILSARHETQYSRLFRS